MDRVITTTELTALLGRIPNQTELNSQDIQLLDVSTEMAASGLSLSSQMANLHNQIWMRLHHLEEKNYWTVIGSIMVESKSNQTKVLALDSMAKQIASHGQTYGEDLKRQLAQFIMQTQQEVLSSPSASPLKSMTEQIWMSFMKTYWRQGVLQQFIENINEELVQMDTNKLLFSLQTIKKVIREGFQTWSDDYTSAQSFQFQQCLEHQMRSIMKIVAFCLADSENKEYTISPGLGFVKEVASVVPAFELFNSQLIEILLQLLNTVQYSEDALASLKEIFAFRESGEKKDQHNKIAKKMFGVLETLLKRYIEGVQQIEQRQRLRSSIHFDKQSGSTEDTFFSKTTLRKREQRSSLASIELLQLLHSYLLRYVPFMNAVGSEDDLEIESEQTTKLYFSKQLYDYFGQHYWKFIRFLISVGNGLDLNLVQKPQHEIQIQNIFALCIKLMLDLYSKLKLSHDPVLGQLIEVIILKITPLQRSFKRIYGCLQLIQDQNRIYVPQQLRDIPDEYIQNYKEILKKIQSQKSTSNIYKNTIINLIDNVMEQARNLQNSESVYDIVNSLNRITWSIVASEEVGSLVVFGESYLNRFAGAYIENTIQVKSSILKKLYSNNLKYLLQIGIFSQYPDFLCSNLHKLDSDELYLEFSLIILSKIFLRQNFDFRQISNPEEKTLQRINMIVTSIGFITQQGYHSQCYPQIYPAMLRLLSKMITFYSDTKERLQCSSTFAKEILQHLIYEQIQGLTQGLSEINTMDMPLLEKINQFCIFLELMNEHLITANTQTDNQSKGYYWILKHHCKRLEEIFFKNIEYSYKVYSQQVVAFRIQNFQVGKINEFRERYNYLLVQQMKMTKIWLKKEPSSQKIRKIISDKVQIFKNAQGRLSQDFQFQPQYKCMNYFNFLHEFLKTLVAFKENNFKQTLNNTVMFVMDVLAQQNARENQKFIYSKIAFLKQIIQDFSEDLQQSFFEILAELYSSFYDRTMTVRELLLETIQLFFQKVQQLTKRSSSWESTISFFKKTYEHLIIFSEKNEELFRRISRLFNFQIIVLSNSELRIDNIHRNYSNCSNFEILQLLLRDHLYSNVGNRFPTEIQEQHNSLLRNILQENNQAKFLISIKDYRICLLRWVKKPEGESY